MVVILGIFCELDAVRLKGKRAPVPAYEAIAPIHTATPEQRAYVSRYSAALQCYRRGEVDKAVSIWTALDLATGPRKGTSAPAVMAQRARAGDAISELSPGS